MAENLPDPQEIRDTAATGAQLSRQEVADLAKLERDMTGRIEKGGPAATAQRIYTKQQEFLRKADNVIAQPIEQISKEEADEIRDLETAALVGAAPASGSVSSHLQAITDHNETLGTALPKVSLGDELKEEAAATASETAKITEDGKIPKGSIAAEMQSMADQVKNFEEGVYDPTIGDMMKADAALMQSQTALETGGIVPKDSGPSQAQSLADRVKNMEAQGLP